MSSLPRLSRTHPLPAPAEITTSTSFTELEAWETVARQHIELAKRAYDAWVFHREHFFAAGGDLVDRLEGRGEGPDGTDLARGAWEEVRLRGEKAEAVLKRKFPPSRHQTLSSLSLGRGGIGKLTALPAAHSHHSEIPLFGLRCRRRIVALASAAVSAREWRLR